MASESIIIPYAPRKHFLPLHNRTQRFAAVVAHRRAGKTVAEINDKIRSALTCPLQNPRIGYIAPFYKQAKNVAWTYLKEYSHTIPGHMINESELRVDYPNGGQVRLYGADNPDALRGIYLDDVTLDEPADMNPRFFPEIIRPTLADRKGRASFIGTPKGKNGFYDICEIAKKSPDWLYMMLKSSETGILDPAELADARQMMTDNQYMQEFECSFDAAIQGAVYGQWIVDAENEKRSVADTFAEGIPVNTAWDLGFDDTTAIWFWQQVGRETRIIDYYENSQQDIKHYCDALMDRPYLYGDHYVPHDARNKLLAAGGRSIVEQAYELGIQMIALNASNQQNQIEATRMLLKNCWLSEVKCVQGINALKQYRFSYDEDLKTFRSKPLHDWSSHAADAFEIIAQVRQQDTKSKEPEKPKFWQDQTADELFAIKGLQSDEPYRDEF